MGRGARTKASALIFAPRTRRAVRAPDHAEGRLKEFLATLNYTGERRALLDFLISTRIGSSGDPGHSDTIDNYAMWIDRRLAGLSPLHGFDKLPCGAEASPEFTDFLQEARIVLSRLGHRIEESCLEELLDTYTGAYLWHGAGFVELSETIERLIDSTPLAHRSRRVVYAKRGEDNAATHYRSANPDRFIACDRRRILDDGWREFQLGERPVTCKKCLAKKRTGRDTDVLWHTETAADKIERLHSGLIEKAVPRILAATRRRLPMRVEEFAQEVRRAVWHSFAAVVAEAYEAAGDPIDDEQVDELRAMWVSSAALPPRGLSSLTF